MWNKPVVEIRIDEYTRGTQPHYMDLQKRLALPAQERHIGRPMAYYFSLVGRINCMTQLWGYDSFADYQARRAAVEAEPAWQEYMGASDGVLRFTDTRLTQRIAFPGMDVIGGPSRAKQVVDFRVYTIHSNQMQTFLSTTQEFCVPVMVRHIGAPLGYYLTRVGNMNQITHVWGYDSMADMEARREARNADPEWKKYLDASDGIYERQQTQILRRMKLFADE